jgi:hypothetical protein
MSLVTTTQGITVNNQLCSCKNNISRLVVILARGSDAAFALLQLQSLLSCHKTCLVDSPNE